MTDSPDSISVSSTHSTGSEAESSSSGSSISSEGDTPLTTRHLIRPGVSKCIFEAMKKKALRLSQKDRVCTLLLQEIDLQAHINYLQRDDFIMGFEDFGWGEENRRAADTAAVFMLRSVFGTWKQPVAFMFFDWPLKKYVIARFVKEIAKEAKTAGLNLVSFISTHADYNVNALDLLEKETVAQKGVQVDEGVLLVGGQEIVPIFDPCTLMVDVRNNLSEGDVLFEKDGVQKVASWKHVRQAYEIDRDLTQHLNKLTEHHVNPDKFSKKSVTSSAQVFSSTVSGFLKTIAGKITDKTTKNLPLEAVETAELLSFFDRIFDSVNGSFREPTADKPLRGPVTEKSPHSRVWLEGKQMLATMRMCKEDPDFLVKSFLTWQCVLGSFERLKKRLAKLGYDTFPARSFNLDPLENCLDLMREWTHKKRNPSLTCTRFSTFYNMALESRDVSGCHAAEGNCEADGLSFLVSTIDFKPKKKY